MHLADQAAGLRLARANTSAPPQPARRCAGPRTIAVTSGKGGVGKTQLSANLAVGLAQEGLRVLALDADLGLASLDLALGVEPRADLLAVVRGGASLDDVLVPTPHGVWLLPACPGRYEMANLELAERSRLLQAVLELAARFDALVIDTGAGIGANSVAFAAVAEEVVLVATGEPTSLRDAYAMAKVLHRRAGLERVRIVANRVVSELEGLEVFERLDGIVRRFLSLEADYLGSVPRDTAVERAGAAGEPYLLAAPRSPAARATGALVRRLLPPRPEVAC